MLILTCSGCSWFTKENDTLATLLEDMKHYRTTSKHRGDLWQHTIWTAQILGRWMHHDEAQKLHLIVETLRALLSERDCYLLEIAGVVHDIGKAGDLDVTAYMDGRRQGDLIYFISREDHERIGFEYIAHDLPSVQGAFSRAYQIFNGGSFNFYKFFNKLGISEDEQKVIAILVGSHKTFSLMLSEPFEQLLHATIVTINSLAQEIRYVPRDVKKLVCMSALLQFADAYATFFPITTVGPSSLFSHDLIVPSPHPHPEDDALVQQIVDKLLARAEQLITSTEYMKIK